MFDSGKKHRIRIICGVSLIVIGILTAFLLIKTQYDFCAYQWLNDLNGFGQKYASVWDCFITRSKGAIYISLLIGSIPVIFGCHICSARKDP